MSLRTLGCKMRKPMKEKLEETGAEGTEVSQQGNASRQGGFRIPAASQVSDSLATAEFQEGEVNAN